MSQQCMRQRWQQVEGGNPCLFSVLVRHVAVLCSGPVSPECRHTGAGLMEGCWDDEGLGISGLRGVAGGATVVQNGEEESQEGLVCRNWYLWLISVVPTYGRWDHGTQWGNYLVAVCHLSWVFQSDILLLHLNFWCSELFIVNYGFHLLNVQQILK